MEINIGQLFLILAAAQGYFLSVLIMHKHGKLFANRFLALLMFLYSVILTHLFLGEVFNAKDGPIVWFVIGLTFLIGPLHYLYTRHLVLPETKRKEWYHMVPFLLFEGFVLAVSINKSLNVSNIFVQKLLIDYSWYHWLILFHVTIYMILTLRVLWRYVRLITDVFSNLDKIRLVWLRNLTYLAFVIMIVYLVENFLILYDIYLSNEFDLTSIIVAVYVYAIGYIGMFKSEVFTIPAVAEGIRQMPEIKYEKTGISLEKAAEHEKKLLDYMKESKPYRDSELTLSGLAEALNIPSHTLSIVINSRLDKNFFNFVNEYRIEQVKKDLIDPEKAHLKILAIAFDAGFNSKSSFNQIFKAHLNMTPSEYKKNLRI